MPRDLILGTAGHIDHGKTALVEALTGIDCDRLPEEKARGITIDIGFATLNLGEYRLGIVDVPGHERFIKNMLAGATGFDLALLVVAADDSVMPQTREHLEILRLLGLRHGLIAMTKCDLGDAETRELVEMETRDLVRGSFLENAPILRTSAASGEGIPELKAAIAATCRLVKDQVSRQWFRMAIDRSFIVQGHGTVVTGSVTSGDVAVGEELEWLPRGEPVRVRSLQNHGRAVERVSRGQRGAINLAGIHHENVVRGQELATPAYLIPSRVLTVHMHCLKNAARPLKHRTSVRFHIGTAEVMGTVTLLDADRLEPGGWALAQVFLREPATATWGQPFVVRAPSAMQTLGGGHVLQPTARKIRRHQSILLERLTDLRADDLEKRALAVAWFNGPAGVGEADLVRGAGIGPDESADTLDRLRCAGKLLQLPGRPEMNGPLFHAEVVRDLEDRLLTALGRLHTQWPLAPGHDRLKLLAALAYTGNEPLVELALDRLIRQTRIVMDGSLLRRADFKPKLSGNLQRVKEKVLAGYREAGLRPPRANSFAGLAGGNADSFDGLMALCVTEGHLVRLEEDYYLHTTVEAAVRQKLQDNLARAPAGLTVAEIRDLLGSGRRYTLMVCGYLDRIGFTRRMGDLRVLADSNKAAAQ